MREHTRHFLPGDAYAPLEGARVLRKADGTGFFLVMPGSLPSGTHLVTGQYRLRLTYRRDNRVADTTSVVLSETGNSAPEQVALDVPWHAR